MAATDSDTQPSGSPSTVTDNARAELEHYCHDYDVRPSDLTVSHRAFFAGWRAALAAGRAETTTATVEWGVQHPDQGYAIRFADKDEAIRAVNATPSLRLVRRDVTAWTDAD